MLDLLQPAASAHIGFISPAGISPNNSKFNNTGAKAIRTKITHTGNIAKIGFEIASNQQDEDSNGSGAGKHDNSKSNAYDPNRNAWTLNVRVYRDNAGQPGTLVAGPMSITHNNRHWANPREFRIVPLRNSAGQPVTPTFTAGDDLWVVVDHPLGSGSFYCSINGASSGKAGTPPDARRAGPLYGSHAGVYQFNGTNYGLLLGNYMGVHIWYSDGTHIGPAGRAAYGQTRYEIGDGGQKRVAQIWEQKVFTANVTSLWLHASWMYGKQPAGNLAVKISEATSQGGPWSQIELVSKAPGSIMAWTGEKDLTQTAPADDGEGYIDWLQFTADFDLLPDFWYKAEVYANSSNPYITYLQEQYVDSTGGLTVYEGLGSQSGPNNGTLNNNINLMGGSAYFSTNGGSTWTLPTVFSQPQPDFAVPLVFQGTVTV